MYPILELCYCKLGKCTNQFCQRLRIEQKTACEQAVEAIEHNLNLKIAIINISLHRMIWLLVSCSRLFHYTADPSMMRSTLILTSFYYVEIMHPL